jgi:hypothetical protein
MTTPELKRKNQTRTMIATAVSVLILPALLVACGKSEWHEVKSPNTGDAQAEAAHGDLTAQTVRPEQTAFVVPERLRGRDTADQDPAQSTALLERNDPVQIVNQDPVKDPIDGSDLVLVRTNQPDPGLTRIFEEADEAPAVPASNAKPSPLHSAAAVANGPIVKRSVTQPPVLEKGGGDKATALKETVKPVITEKKTAPPSTTTPAAKTPKRKVYVPLRYLRSKPVETTKEMARADRFIVIQNIATGKLRVYERSQTLGGPNKMVFETNMINGENEPQTTRRTALGSYKIQEWIKFYQDNAGVAPSWFDPKLESVPLPGSEIEDWMQTYLLPKKGDTPTGYVRGGFGWYTAKIGPNAHAQWMHGTLGWGADKDRFINNVSNFKLKEFYGDPRTFGCTRVENQASAYLQELLPVGTRVIKVYAKESLADESLERYKETPPVQSFDWILSKDDVRASKPHSSARKRQVARHLPADAILEEGTFEVDSKPDAVQFEKLIKTYETEKTQTMMIRMEANLYNLPRSSFHGEFLVDEGRFVNYQHPSELRTGGYSDQLLPRVVVKTAATVQNQQSHVTPSSAQAPVTQSLNSTQTQPTVVAQTQAKTTIAAPIASKEKPVVNVKSKSAKTQADVTTKSAKTSKTSSVKTSVKTPVKTPVKTLGKPLNKTTAKVNAATKSQTNKASVPAAPETAEALFEKLSKMPDASETHALFPAKPSTAKSAPKGKAKPIVKPAAVSTVVTDSAVAAKTKADASVSATSEVSKK